MNCGAASRHSAGIRRPRSPARSRRRSRRLRPRQTRTQARARKASRRARKTPASTRERSRRRRTPACSGRRRSRSRNRRPPRSSMPLASRAASVTITRTWALRARRHGPPAGHLWPSPGTWPRSVAGTRRSRPQGARQHRGLPRRRPEVVVLGVEPDGDAVALDPGTKLIGLRGSILKSRASGLAHRDDAIGSAGCN
jgi:hypothetical protein